MNCPIAQSKKKVNFASNFSHYTGMRLPIQLSVLILILIGLPVYGQTSSIFEELESNRHGQGKVKIVQEEAIARQVDKHIWEQSKQKGIQGYRIRIFSDSGPNASSGFEQTKARFNSLFEQIDIHESFDYPFYKIYVGDFRTRSEAMKELVRIEKQFPEAFIVQTRINYPKIDLNE